MSDPDDDNIVRYGTQLDPYEEDMRAMLKMNPFIPNAAKKRFRKLLDYNINFHKAQELCQLSWIEICKIVPELKSIPNPLKKNKKKNTLRVKLSQELQQTKYNQEECDQGPYWHDPSDPHQTSPDRSRSPHYLGPNCHNEQNYPSNEYGIAKKSFSHQPNKAPQMFTKKNSHISPHQNHMEEADPSLVTSEGIRRTRRFRKRGRNCRGRDGSQGTRNRSPITRNHSPRMRDHSPRMRDHSPRMRDCSPRIRDHSPRMRDCSPRMRDHSPRMREHSARMRNSSPRMRDHSTRMRNSSPGMRDHSPRMRERSPRMRHSSPRMRHSSPRMRDNSPRMRDNSPRMRECSPRMRNSSPRMRDHSPRMRDRSPRMRERSPRMRDRSPRMRDYSQTARSRHDSIPKASSSKDSYERTQIKYSVEALMRGIKRHYERVDENDFSEQPHKAQKMDGVATSEGVATFVYWPEPDRPSQLLLRNEMQPPKHTSTYSYSEDKKFREDPKNYQKIKWENNVNVDYRESDRPSRDGLRSQTHPIETICIEDSDDEYNGPIYEPHTPTDDGNPQFDFNAAYHTEPKSDKQFNLNKPSGALQTCEDKDANAEKDDVPVPVKIRNITPMTETEMKLVLQSINQAIVQIGVQGAGPKFSGSSFKSGWIFMLCGNHKSRKWLEKTVPTLKPWPEAWLSVTSEGKLISLSILIPEKEGITPSTALELLRVQNPGLDTVNWKVTRTVKTHSGQIVFLSVDKASFKALKLMNFKANLGMDKVGFWIPGKAKRGSKGNRLEKVPLLPTPISYTSEQNKDSEPCAVDSNSMVVAKKRHHHPKKSRHSINQTIDTKPSLLAKIKESKSPRAETWIPKPDQPFGFDKSFSSSDWTTW